MSDVIDLKELRQALGMTQAEFADTFHLPLSTLFKWEQGASRPTKATRAYLHVIAQNPRFVMRVLRAVERNGSASVAVASAVASSVPPASGPVVAPAASSVPSVDRLG